MNDASSDNRVNENEKNGDHDDQDYDNDHNNHERAEDPSQESEVDVARNCDFSITLNDEGDISNPEGDQSSNSNDSIEPQPCTSNEYKIVGDNIDKNIRASFQRLNHQTKSLHYFHTFAVRDRVDFSGLSDVTPHYVKIDPATLLPGPTDLQALLNDLQVIVSRYVHVCTLDMCMLMIVFIIVGFLCGV